MSGNWHRKWQENSPCQRYFVIEKDYLRKPSSDVNDGDDEKMSKKIRK